MNDNNTLPAILRRIRTGLVTEEDAERVDALIRASRDESRARMDLETLTDTEEENWKEHADRVNHPSHYTGGDIECIDAIEAALGHEGAADFCRGNVIKYAWRAASKGEAEDMRKAAWYAERAAQLMEKTQ